MEDNKTIKEQSDIELMLRVKEDEEEAFSEIFNRYQSRLQRFFQKFFPYSDAEDLCQEVFQGLWNRRKPYKPTADFHTYLYAIARRRRAMKIRSLKQDPLFLALSQSQDNEYNLQLYLNIPDKQKGPAEKLLAKELTDQIREAIKYLPEKQREVMELILEGLTEPEIARQLGCSRGTVSSRKTRATARLKQKLGNA